MAAWNIIKWQAEMRERFRADYLAKFRSWII